MSQKDYGCFFCSGKSTSYDGQCISCGQIVNVSPVLLTITLGEYKPLEILGRGFYGWTLKVEDNYQPFALKIIPKHRLKEGVLADKEARALAVCSTHRNIARFFRSFTTHISISGKSIEVLCMAFEFIDNARPLSKLLSDDSLKLAKSDVVAILAGITSGLNRMHANNLWHDDLHDDNVLVRTVTPDENISERFEPKLIDFGSAKPLRSDEPEHGDRSDYSYLAKHIYNTILRFELGNNNCLTPADRSFSERLRRLAHQLSDRNVSRRSLIPADIILKIRAAESECATGHNYPTFKEMREKIQISFTEPLANTNALNLAPQDITPLFQDSLGWQARIRKSEPVLVVGPRGCGKTMFLRFLSIASNARPTKGENCPEDVEQRLNKIQHIGFLINIGQLRTPFIRSSFKILESENKSSAEDFCREFLNAHFAFEVIRTFIWLYSEKLIYLTKDDLKVLQSVVEEFITDGNGSSFQNIESVAETLDRKVMELSNLGNPLSYCPSNLCRDDVLHRLAQAIRRTSWGISKEVWFMLDDYSVTVLPVIAQHAYNPVLFRLSTEFRIKISSEGEGPILNDSLGRKYREGRELTKLNLGEVYFLADENEGRKFFEQILEARFKETGKGNMPELIQLLGEHDNEENFGSYIRDLKRTGDARFHGFGLLCSLCSGDVSFIIELLHALTKGCWGGSPTKLTPKQQDDIVKQFAQRQLSELHATAEYGEKLHMFAVGLGKLIRNYLIKSRGKGSADERLRVEIEGLGDICVEAQAMHDALLRHSVLVSAGAGKSKEALPTRKFYFRRLFAPCFPFSPNRKGCVAITLQEYEKWLLNPQTIWEDPPEEGEHLPGLVHK
jgi:serine/threonine protein kinase